MAFVLGIRGQRYMKKAQVGQRLGERRQKFKLTPYLLMLPSIALFTMFTFWPFLKTIILSFSYTDKKGDFVGWAGIDNYVRVIGSTLFSKTMGNTFKFALMIGVGTLCVAMVLALLSASKEKGSRLYEVMYALPMAVSTFDVNSCSASF